MFAFLRLVCLAYIVFSSSINVAACIRTEPLSECMAYSCLLLVQLPISGLRAFLPLAYLNTVKMNTDLLKFLFQLFCVNNSQWKRCLYVLLQRGARLPSTVASPRSIHTTEHRSSGFSPFLSMLTIAGFGFYHST